jgi:hypothetical protein
MSRASRETGQVGQVTLFHKMSLDQRKLQQDQDLFDLFGQVGLVGQV